jgi:hypothetical protein
MSSSQRPSRIPPKENCILMSHFLTSDCLSPSFDYFGNKGLCLCLCLKSGRKIICYENNIATHKHII